MTTSLLRHVLVPFGAAALAICLAALPTHAAPIAAPEGEPDGARLLREPDLHGDTLVFSHAGDLWTAPVDGGVARRLTSHDGRERFPRFSPDGRWIAFTGQIDGDEQVYLMPATGGPARQLTFYPALGPLPPRWGVDNQVYGFSPDGSAVLFRSMRDGWDRSDTQLFLAPVDGGLPTALAMPESGGGDLSPDGRRVVYSPTTRDFRHWKRYEGGWAQDLVIFDRDTREIQTVTDHPRTDRDPMWIGDRIYFASDRSGVLNLYTHDPASGTTEALTDFPLWDVRWPAADHVGSRIVYERNGALEILDLDARRITRPTITVPTDALAQRAAMRDVSSRITDAVPSPNGKRVVVVARGELFSVPAEHGPTLNLTQTSGMREMEPVWSPDGDAIIYVGETDRMQALYRIDARGQEAPTRLTEPRTGSLFQLHWSPTGDHVAFRDQAARLYVLDLDGGAVTEIADDPSRFGLDHAWSPDGRHIAFSLADDTGLRSLHVWSAEDGQVRRVTEPMWSEFAPAWSSDGAHLYHLANRHFRPTLGDFERNYIVNQETGIYAFALQTDAPHPFPPRDDRSAEAPADGDAAKKADGDDKDGDDDEAMRIDHDGLAARVARVPLPAANYVQLTAAPGHLLYATFASRPMGQGRGATLYAFDLAQREAKQIADGVRQGSVTQDGKHVLVWGRGGLRLIPLAQPSKAVTVDTSNLMMMLDPVEEWAAIFDQAWRLFRDYFYVDNMHGYDWEAIGARYRALLPHVGHRHDLNDLIGDMIAELNVSHAYVAGGDLGAPPRPDVALLGARFERDGDVYRVADVFTGHNEEPDYRAPLTEVGIDVQVGDTITAIQGVPLRGDDNPYRLLRHVPDGAITLTVQRGDDDPRDVLVEPITDEDSLLYLRWIEGRRALASELSDGEIGYLHIPDMGPHGLSTFIKYYYPQLRKRGLVIDVRNNGGGNVSGMIIQRLIRDVLMLDFERNSELTDPYPNGVFHGPMAVLIDADTASDGDQFAHVFREAGLGPLIGTRTWGGVVGIYGGLSLVDGGSVSVPEAGSTNPQGEWIIEGTGVAPDIEIDDNPKARLEGRDVQLEAAVDAIREALAREEVRALPAEPAPAPVKTRYR
ncbi:MAG: S41 family peptidase [Acidobacteriota bacterium]